MIIFIKTRSVLMKLLIDKYVVLVCSKFMHKVHLHIQTATVQCTTQQKTLYFKPFFLSKPDWIEIQTAGFFLK